jgi:hypothetical protein
MKKQAYMIVTLVMFMVVVGLSSAKAQTNAPMRLQVDVPFAFRVDGQILPAGEYTLTSVSPASDVKILQLRDKSGHAAVIHTSSVIGKTQEKAKLVFNRYGDQYFFAQAWLPADNVGMQARKSRIEKVTARELASVERATEVVALTAKR